MCGCHRRFFEPNLPPSSMPHPVAYLPHLPRLRHDLKFSSYLGTTFVLRHRQSQLYDEGVKAIADGSNAVTITDAPPPSPASPPPTPPSRPKTPLRPLAPP
eukprot:CAMPEP_0174902254 /NCGR_PEP_ID=MMETSP0167-20121228/37356_1 /TAXON_ID=38298 /ORGANISM="Rhodella maculata, Strain CCMP736" /LENGTH=100 /DNA_ID=CAMNT_0016144203 /DNA_START=388 /DNA_END=686 /DNA_ORIENTATION=+